MALDVVTESAPVLAALENPGQPLVIGFFSEKSEACQRTLPAFEAFCSANPSLRAFLVDVTKVRDVHPRFEITAMPTVVLVRDGMLLQKVTGPQKAEAYARALRPGAPPRPDAPFVDAPRAKARAEHLVVVYTTDVCPWCTRVKAYLRQNNVSFREINVQHDPQAARRMVERSGQQGVPQLDIDGLVVVGFDKPRIDSLLGLSARRA
jgi:glutaredoxin-like YruB-family protein